MNDKQEKWLQVYIETGDASKAVAAAYPDVSEASRPSKASQLKTRLANEIHQASIKTYGKDAPMMMNVIKQLALSAEQEAVKLKAASEWLTRAKHDAPIEVDVKDSRTFEQLQNQLKEQLQTVDDSLLKTLGLSREHLTHLADNERRDH